MNKPPHWQPYLCAHPGERCKQAQTACGKLIRDTVRVQGRGRLTSRPSQPVPSTPCGGPRTPLHGLPPPSAFLFLPEPEAGAPSGPISCHHLQTLQQLKASSHCVVITPRPPAHQRGASTRQEPTSPATGPPGLLSPWGPHCLHRVLALPSPAVAHLTLPSSAVASLP